MPYGGKPSKGCLSCRQRKIACDQVVPSCTQCWRIKRLCPGYRDHVSLLFRNENEDVARKVNARWKDASTARERSDSASTAESEATSSTSGASIRDNQYMSEQRQDQLHLMASQLQVPIGSYRFQIAVDDRALGFFSSTYLLSNNMLPASNGDEFVLSTTAMTARGPLSLPSTIEDHLLGSMTAVGLAGFAGQANSPELAILAREKYISAIKLVNRALLSPHHSKTDSTLQAVLILGMFENVAGTSRRSFEAWVNHMNGAASILKLRGRDQFKTPYGRALFLRAVSCLLIACSAKGSALPSYVEELNMVYGETVDDPTGLPWRYHQEFIKFGKLRADCATGVLKGKALISKALEIDGNLAAIFADVPDDFKYTTVFIEPEPEIFILGYFHVYNNLLAVNFWNAMRLNRLILHQLILRTIPDILCIEVSVSAMGNYQKQTQVSTGIMHKVQSDIVASVPQHLGSGLRSSISVQPLHNLNTVTSSDKLPEKFNIQTQDHPLNSYDDLTGTSFGKLPTTTQIHPTISMDRPGCGQYIMWPLYIAGCTSVTSDASRAYIIRTLRSIAREMGLMQALELADSLEGRDLEDCSEFLR